MPSQALLAYENCKRQSLTDSTHLSPRSSRPFSSYTASSASRGSSNSCNNVAWTSEQGQGMLTICLHHHKMPLVQHLSKHTQLSTNFCAPMCEFLHRLFVNKFLVHKENQSFRIICEKQPTNMVWKSNLNHPQTHSTNQINFVCKNQQVYP